jgi:glycosyltransferase involved in cell wall biosynthesis
MKVLAGKRILLVVENNAVPFDRRVWREALTLRDAGAAVSVICPVFGTDSEPFQVLEEIEIYRYRVTFSSGGVTGYAREYLGAFLNTLRLYHRVLRKHGRIDVVHVANPPDIFWPLGWYVRLWKTRFIFDEHDLTPETYLSRFEKTEEQAGMIFPVLRAFQRLSYRASHAIIATNDSYRERVSMLDARYGPRTFVVRNGPDTRSFKPVPARPELKKGFRYMGAYIGIMAIQDGVDYVIRAMDHLVHKEKFEDVIVYLIGTGDDVPRLKGMVQELNLEKHIVFTGRIPDQPALEILSTADICLSPDPFNPLNDLSTMNKVMEYMAMGKPMVSFELKEARFSAADAALYVHNNDVEAFAGGMKMLLQDPGMSKTMGESGSRRIQEHLCWERQSENLLRAYEYVLGSRSPV